jgi:hypothetical protein
MDEQFLASKLGWEPTKLRQVLPHSRDLFLRQTGIFSKDQVKGRVGKVHRLHLMAHQNHQGLMVHQDLMGLRDLREDREDQGDLVG